MNRVLITKVGDQIRQELKVLTEPPKKQKTPARLVPLSEQRRSIQNSLFPHETDRENPLYKKTLSEVAMGNLTRTASLSLAGVAKQKEIEESIRSELNLPSELPYLNKNLSKLVKKMVDDKGVKSRRKRQLISELKKIDKVIIIEIQSQDGLEFSTIVEESELTTKMKELVNVHGKLEQLHRRYIEQQKNNLTLQKHLKLNLERMNERKQLQIDSINPMSPEKMKTATNTEFQSLFTDTSQERYYIINEDITKEYSKGIENIAFQDGVKSMYPVKLNDGMNGLNRQGSRSLNELYYTQNEINQITHQKEKIIKIFKASIRNTIGSVIYIQTNNEGIQWDQSGTQIIIRDKNQTEIILRSKFKHCNYSSFARQLNLFQFKSTKNSEGQLIYYNSNYTRERQEIFKKTQTLSSTLLDDHNNMQLEFADLLTQQQYLKDQLAQQAKFLQSIMMSNKKIMKTLLNLMMGAKQRKEYARGVFFKIFYGLDRLAPGDFLMDSYRIVFQQLGQILESHEDFNPFSEISSYSNHFTFQQSP